MRSLFSGISYTIFFIFLYLNFSTECAATANCFHGGKKNFVGTHGSVTGGLITLNSSSYSQFTMELCL